MDLSNLRTSLREEESSTLRRTAHLRAAEDELNAFFRSSALGLTTLYRQGVAASKASYEKGYAHALAHVLELWDKDRDWLKGYLQRRIEAIEAADNEDDAADETHLRDAPPPQAGPSMSVPVNLPKAVQGQAVESPRHNKRSRSAFLHSSSSARDEDDSPIDRRLHRMPQGPRFSQPSNLSSSSSSTSFPTSFHFSAPVSYPSTSTASFGHSPSKPAPARVPRSNAPVIKTSNPATSRRRLQKLKGLRAGRERVIEIERPSHDDMVDDGDELLPLDDADANAHADVDDAWTDDDEPLETTGTSPTAKQGAKGDAKRAKKVWTERAQPTTHADAQVKVLERLDRRKRRRARNIDPSQHHDSPETSREITDEDHIYHS